MKKLFKIVIGSHYFRVIKPNDRIRALLYKLSDKYSIRGWVNERGRKRYKIIKRFMSPYADGSEFRLHIGQLKEFLWLLDDQSITPDLYDVVNEGLYVPKKTTLKLNEGWELRDYQKECKEFILEEDPESLHSKMVSMPTGTGKFHPNDTPIKIPGGWTTIGDLNKGDDIINKDGSTCNVTGIYPQGIQDVYDLTFEDGRTVKAGLEHLWRINVPTEKGRKWKVVTTKDIMLLLDLRTYKDDLYIDLPISEDSPTVELHTDPLLIGAIITYAYTSYMGKDVYNDVIILDYLDSIIKKPFKIRCAKWLMGQSVYDRYNQTYLTTIGDMLSNKRHLTEMSIPAEYLNSSTKQRRELLTGILYEHFAIKGLSGTYNYTTISKQLANDIQYLVRSLGGICTIDVSTTLISNNIPKKYNLTISKLDGDGDDVLQITHIEPAGKAECRCISIDHYNRLYVTKDFIVTHNTVTALATLTELSNPIVICILPTYMTKWAKDCQEILKVSPKDIMMVRGGAQLKGLIEAASTNPPKNKIYIISLKTIQNAVKEIEQHNGDLESLGYATPIEDLYSNLGIGTILIDEVHQHLYAVYKLVTNANVPLVLGLSATLMSNDNTLDTIQHMMFPKELRYDKVKMKKYIKTIPVSYDFKAFVKDRIQINERGANNYSHIAFERSILKNHRVKENYLNMMSNILQVGYVSNYEDGDKAVIFAATMNMCDAIVEHLKRRYPKYDIRRYMEKDPYENAIDSQIRVTTIQSLGTAIDVPGLRVTILTNSISSPVANLQVLGRLRELKDRDVKFFYIYCNHIPKQRAYHLDKLKLFSDRVLSITELHYPNMI